MTRALSLPLLVLVSAVAVAGCKSSDAKSARPSNERVVTVRQDKTTGAPKQRPKPAAPQPDPLAEADPCGARLHDIAGAMLFYYAVNKRMPEKLEDLRSVAELGQELNFTCPASGQPYVYDAIGLQYPGRDDRLLLYDATPAHGAARGGIVAFPAKGNQPPSVYAVTLQEAVFRAYKRPVAEGGR